MATQTTTRCPQCQDTCITDPIDGDYVTCDGCGLYHYTGDRLSM